MSALGVATFCCTAFEIIVTFKVVGSVNVAVVLRDISDESRGAVWGTGLITGSDQVTTALDFDGCDCVFD